MKQKIGIIGLGIMGSAMAPNLIKEGFSVTGYDIVPDRLEECISLAGETGLDLHQRLIYQRRHEVESIVGVAFAYGSRGLEGKTAAKHRQTGREIGFSAVQ